MWLSELRSERNQAISVSTVQVVGSLCFRCLGCTHALCSLSDFRLLCAVQIVDAPGARVKVVVASAGRAPDLMGSSVPSSTGGGISEGGLQVREGGKVGEGGTRPRRGGSGLLSKL